METPEVSDEVRLKIYRMPKMREFNVNFIDEVIDAFQRSGLVITEFQEPEDTRESDEAAYEIMRRIVGTYVDDSDAITQMIEELERADLRLRPNKYYQVKEITQLELEALFAVISGGSWDVMHSTAFLSELDTLGIGFFKKP